MRGKILFLCVSLGLGAAGAANADSAQEQASAAPDARAFVEHANAGIVELLQKPPSPERARCIGAAMDALIDWAELARRAVDGASLTNAQRDEVRDLLRRWVSRRYLQRLAQVAAYRAVYAEPRPISPRAWRVRVELTALANRREPPTELEYVVARADSGAYHVVDIVTEGASLGHDCHTELAKLFIEGYPAVVKRLREAASRD
jgi:ABC-type transporter MlaC component